MRISLFQQLICLQHCTILKCIICIGLNEIGLKELKILLKRISLVVWEALIWLAESFSSKLTCLLKTSPIIWSLSMVSFSHTSDIASQNCVCTSNNLNNELNFEPSYWLKILPGQHWQINRIILFHYKLIGFVSHLSNSKKVIWKVGPGMCRMRRASNCLHDLLKNQIEFRKTRGTAHSTMSINQTLEILDYNKVCFEMKT